MVIASIEHYALILILVTLTSHDLVMSRSVGVLDKWYFLTKFWSCQVETGTVVLTNASVSLHFECELTERFIPLGYYDGACFRIIDRSKISSLSHTGHQGMRLAELKSVLIFLCRRVWDVFCSGCEQDEQSRSWQHYLQMFFRHKVCFLEA